MPDGKLSLEMIELALGEASSSDLFKEILRRVQLEFEMLDQYYRAASPADRPIVMSTILNTMVHNPEYITYQLSSLNSWYEKQCIQILTWPEKEI